MIPNRSTKATIQVYVFSSRDSSDQGNTITGPALEFNAGLLPDV